MESKEPSRCKSQKLIPIKELSEENSSSTDEIEHQMRKLLKKHKLEDLRHRRQ